MTPETLALLMRTSYGLRFEGYVSAAFVEEQRKEAAVNMERNAERAKCVKPKN